MIRLLIAILYIFNISNTYANNKSKIIENLNNTENLSFKFEQNINGKIEYGDCIIQYPKKISCKYEKNNNKILISNGKSLVIKTNVSYYHYPLEKTSLNLILDKKFLINKISDLKEKNIDNRIISYSIAQNENKINVFFDSKTFDLIGWQTKDIYKNLNITYFSSIKKNQYVNDKIFRIPSSN